MLGAFSKAFFHSLSRSATLKRLASRYGMSGSRGFARRFIAGETLPEAIDAARVVESRGLAQTLDYLGESVSTLAEAEAATREYLTMIDAIVAAGIGRNISLKLTQLGLDVDKAECLTHLRSIVAAAAPHECFVRIDMENSPYVDPTLDIFETLWREGLQNVGVVIQAALRRSEQDLERVIGLGARVRLVKGAYKEPADAAFQRKSEVDESFVRLAGRLLAAGTFPALATHDPSMIKTAKRLAAEHGRRADTFEFQMLYGIRRDLQAALKSDGYGMRVYIPFGREWFPYFMRRLGERPANVGFVLKGVIGDR
jgi:proline dehydrogenase